MQACPHDRQKRSLLCVQQVYKSCVGGHCTYKAFYKVCCKLASNKFTMLTGLEIQLLVKLGDLDTSMPNAAAISLAVCCKDLKVIRCPLVCWPHFKMSGFHEPTWAPLNTYPREPVICYVSAQCFTAQHQQSLAT